MEVNRVEENKTISTEPNKTDKKKIFAIVGLVLAIVVALVTNLLPATDINKVIVVAYVGFGLEVVAVILGIMGLKGNKTVAVIAIVVSIIIGIVSGGWKKPIDNYYKGLEKGKLETYQKAFPDFYNDKITFRGSLELRISPMAAIILALILGCRFLWRTICRFSGPSPETPMWPAAISSARRSTTSWNCAR